ncbi:MAG: glycosyltransferase family 2 protein [Sphingobacteriales bacterium]|nr:glycosyltransferase family 2 protein [Sphingobacteriales bacterium]
MYWLKLFFWLSFSILFYGFVGYIIFLWIVTQLKKRFTKLVIAGSDDFAEVTFIVAAYNEKDIIELKIINTLSLDYPEDKLQILFITDGSDDGTEEIVRKYPQVKLMHQPERKGKSAALNRAMKSVATPFVVFSDANSLLNKEAVTHLIKKFTGKQVGGVSGEKKIVHNNINKPGLGEGFYWKYESFLKNLESQFYSLVGSAGELFSIRTSLYRPIPVTILLDDFYTALSINEQGYTIKYAKNAVASEFPSASMKEEQKRKVRIAAGSFQASSVFTGLLNILKFPAFAFQFFSHKIIRWFLAPVCIIMLFISNYFLTGYDPVYLWIWYAQLLFYCMALAGWLFQNLKQIIPAFYFPFYFLFMNYCTVLGWFRYLSGKQNVLWEKSGRELPADKATYQ